MNKILVDEDDEHEREGLRILLEKAGFTVKAAANGRDAALSRRQARLSGTILMGRANRCSIQPSLG